MNRQFPVYCPKLNYTKQPSEWAWNIAVAAVVPETYVHAYAIWETTEQGFTST